ncbi:hypothetical protein FDG2_1814 [Candidatus Protofrankia californiensis]|uniref:Type I restriction enzyme R protein N-terminal domain-containing protein n=1 Tax=Candidatus Protofrankia californiensis TaxID=1839754 RepID=A0A1C3NWB1_9ACTN|nr:hypothetical protein FDG2_1814 [Candidatus Protofrankia californiensis]
MERAVANTDEVESGAPDPDAPLESIAEDEIFDYITGRPVKQTEKEKVRQRVARALFHEYGIAVDDMQPDFPIPAGAGAERRRVRKADIAVFAHEASHTVENLRRVVVCKPEPKTTKVAKIRSHEQAQKDLDELQELMGYEDLPQLRYGLWTNDHDLFFLYKDVHRFGVNFEPRADWPLADESVGSRSVGRLHGPAAPRRGVQAEDQLPALSQLHPR